MAITWTCTISNERPDQFRADINFKRVDDVTGDEFSISYHNTVIETAAQRIALLDAAWAEWEKEQVKQTAIDAFITNLEQLAKANLEAREV
jgi:hypothetical protein